MIYGKGKYLLAISYDLWQEWVIICHILLFMAMISNYTPYRMIYGKGK